MARQVGATSRARAAVVVHIEAGAVGQLMVESANTREAVTLTLFGSVDRWTAPILLKRAGFALRPQFARLVIDLLHASVGPGGVEALTAVRELARDQAVGAKTRPRSPGRPRGLQRPRAAGRGGRLMAARYLGEVWDQILGEVTGADALADRRRGRPDPAPRPLDRPHPRPAGTTRVREGRQQAPVRPPSNRGLHRGQRSARANEAASCATDAVRIATAPQLALSDGRHPRSSYIIGITMHRGEARVPPVHPGHALDPQLPVPKR